MQQVRARIERIAGTVLLLNPGTQVRRWSELLQEAFSRLRVGCLHRVEMILGELETVAGRLDSLSPLAVLARGYSLAWKLPENALLRDARALSRGDTVRLQLHRGGADLTVDKIHPAEDASAESGDETNG
jgi:exodeoxyribonuclease VII large subunit